MKILVSFKTFVFLMSVFSVSELSAFSMAEFEELMAPVAGDTLVCEPDLTGATYRAVNDSQCGAENSCAWELVSVDGQLDDPVRCIIPPGVSCESHQVRKCDEIVGEGVSSSTRTSLGDGPTRLR